MSFNNKFRTNYIMTFSWKELVCHGLLKKVGDPSLAKVLLNIVMKERWLFLEEEAREFHTGSEYWEMLNYFRLEKLWMKGSRCGTLKKSCSMRTPYQVIQRQVMHELRLSWKERIPEERRQAVTRHKESKLLRWRVHYDDDDDDDIESLRKQYPSIENSIKWYGEIHEGRYYLFWDKKLALPIADWAARAQIQSKAFLMSGFDINIIDGEGLNKNIPESWVYAYDQWIKNPMGWGARKSEFMMVHERGKKEKMHIDDMFLKE